MTIEKHCFPLKAPFIITGYTFETTDAVWVTLEEDGCRGRGEAIGVYYTGETADTMAAQLQAVATIVEAGVSLEEIQAILPSGGARNALDCAMWDLKMKREGSSIWQTLNITPKPLSSVATIVIGSPEEMAKQAIAYAVFPNLKTKLSADNPIARLEAIRAARPDATLIVDVNQGWTFEALKKYTPAAERLKIAMIEQPLPREDDAELEGYTSPVPLGADESCLDASEYAVAAKRYDIINIKLDKCGGLTEALKIVELARKDGKKLMIGNMTGSSLSMAPAYVIGQYCQYIDIDGPLFLKHDINNALQYSEGGMVSIPNKTLWG